MSLITFFFGTSTKIKRNVDGKEAVIVLDALISESVKYEAEATDSPVESGAAVTDHVIIRPNTLTISGVITETPLNLGASIQGAAATVGAGVGKALASKLGQQTLGQVGGAVAGGLAGKTLAGLLGQGSGGSRLGQAATELQSARDSKTPITIVTGLQSYENYILTSVQIDRDQNSGRSIRVQLTLKQLIKASTIIVANIPKITSAVSKKSIGKQNTATPDSRQQQRGSLAYSGLKGLGAFK